MRLAIGVMARAPSSEGKSRLAADLSTDRLAALRKAFVADTLQTVCATPDVDVVIFVTPAGSEAEIRDCSPQPVPVLPQHGADLGERMLNAFRELFDARRYDAAMLVGTDVPLMTVEHLNEAVQLLRTRGGVVLGPADDGGYYLIGVTRVFDGLFQGIEWGSDSVLAHTLRAAERLHVDACLIRGAYDIDTLEDLRRLERDLELEPPSVAVHARCALRR